MQSSSGCPFFYTLSKIKYKWSTKGGQGKNSEENCPNEIPISSSRRKFLGPIKKEEPVDPLVGSPRTCILPIYTQENHVVVDFAKSIRGLGPDYEPYAVALETAIEKPIEIAFKDMLKIMSEHGKFPPPPLIFHLIFDPKIRQMRIPPPPPPAPPPPRRRRCSRTPGQRHPTPGSNS